MSGPSVSLWAQRLLIAQNADDAGRVIGGVWRVSQPSVLLASGTPTVGWYTLTASVPDGTKAITWSWSGSAATAHAYGGVNDINSVTYGVTSDMPDPNGHFAAGGVVPLDANKQFKIYVGNVTLTYHSFLQTGYYL